MCYRQLNSTQCMHAHTHTHTYTQPMQSHMAAHFKLCIMHPYIMPQILSMTVQQILCMHACMHMGSHFDLKGFFKVSLPALQVPANSQSMAASSLDPEVAFGPQQEWESPIQERPWVGHNAASMIPHDANEEQIIEAMELWGMPAEAWPQMDKKKKRLSLLLHSEEEGSPRHPCVSWKADVYHKAST